MSGRILYVNEANARLVGRPARELIGRPVNLLLPPALRERSKGLLATLSREGAIHAELPNVRGDGATVYVGLSAEVARDAAGNPICIVATIRDLSADLQRLEMLNASALSVASAPAGEVLEAIVRVARLLIGARYAALGVGRGAAHDPAAGHRGRPAQQRLSGGSSAHDLVPGRARADRGHGLRPPVPHRQDRRAGVRLRRRAAGRALRRARRRGPPGR